MRLKYDLNMRIFLPHGTARAPAVVIELDIVANATWALDSQSNPIALVAECYVLERA